MDIVKSTRFNFTRKTASKRKILYIQNELPVNLLLVDNPSNNCKVKNCHRTVIHRSVAARREKKVAVARLLLFFGACVFNFGDNLRYEKQPFICG